MTYICIFFPPQDVPLNSLRLGLPAHLMELNVPMERSAVVGNATRGEEISKKISSFHPHFLCSAWVWFVTEEAGLDSTLKPA